MIKKGFTLYTEIESMFSRIKSIVKEFNIVKNLLLMLSVLTINFAVFVSYYDINSFILIDLTTISRFSLNFIYTYALSSGITIVLLFLIKSILPYFYATNYYKRKYSIIINRYIIDSKYTRYAFTLVLFIYLYTGFINSLYLIGILILMIGIHILNKLGKYYIITSIKRKKKIQEKIKKVSTLDLKDFFKNQYIELKANFIAESNVTKKSLNLKIIKIFFTSYIGIIVICFSFALGIFRADFVEQTMHVKIKEKEYILFFVNSNGIILYDQVNKDQVNKDQVKFVPWDNLKDLYFIYEKKRNLKDMF